MLNSPVTQLTGVGPRTQSLLAKLRISSWQDLLFHLPIRYEDRTQITPIAQLVEGDRVMVQGEVQNVAVIGQRRVSLVCRLVDQTGAIQLRFYHFNAAQRQRLALPGVITRCFGELRRNYLGGLEMVHPEYRQAEQIEELGLSNHLTAVYPTTKGLQQSLLRKLIAQVMNTLTSGQQLAELLPEEWVKKNNLPSLLEAIDFLHHPAPGLSCAAIQDNNNRYNKRLIIEELLAHQLSLQQLRQQIRQIAAPPLAGDSVLRSALIAELPFQLTSAQQRVLTEILHDLAQAQPMLRLLQGDVGCGKTIVAALAALQAVQCGYQVTLMAPTELLAEQHYKNFTAWLAPLKIRLGFLTSKQRSFDQQDQIIIGTHALFQRDVNFARLGLLIVDEQHRFGVQQRLSLKQKGVQQHCHPHQLIMTATPIPRTLAMLAYADLDCSSIDELPPGRQAITTLIASNTRRQEIIQRVRANCCSGRQAYWVCTLIDESEVLQCQAAENIYNELQQQLSDIRVALIHGRLKTDEKQHIMQQFCVGEIDLLIATTVIEVGVDVPNASLMIIENAERLGLAQLHQLRGRVGRGTQQSFCVLLYQGPLSKMAQNRLAAIRGHQDGYKIAQMDLEMRGPGDVLGTRQAGLMQLKIADIVRDQPLLEQVQLLAVQLLQLYPKNIPLLMRRWLAGVQQFAEV